MASKNEVYLVVSGTSVLGDYKTDEQAQTSTRELAVASWRFTQVLSPEELNKRAHAWAENDNVETRPNKFPNKQPLTCLITNYYVQ